MSTPTPAQVRQALQNHQRRACPPGSRIWAALDKQPNRTAENILLFPRSLPGWLRHCRKCGHRFRLPFHAATQRDDREKLCVPCWVQNT